jgi:hypothetical protein
VSEVEGWFDKEEAKKVVGVGVLLYNSEEPLNERR